MSSCPLTCPLLRCKCLCLRKFFKFVEMSKCLDVCYLLFAIVSACFSGNGGGGGERREKTTTVFLKKHIVIILY
jgi:hypothetical protein